MLAQGSGMSMRLLSARSQGAHVALILLQAPHVALITHVAHVALLLPSRPVSALNPVLYLV